MTPHRSQCPDCDAIRRENDALKASAKSILRQNIFGAAWRAFASMGIMAAAIVVAGAVRGEMAKPDPPETCHETAEIITMNGTTRICKGGGRLETELLPKQDSYQQVLIRCRCGQQQDGGAQ